MSRTATSVAPRRADRRPFLVLFARDRLLPEAIPFQDPIDEICTQPPPAFLRSAHYLVILLFLTLLAIGAFTKVDVVVVAGGRLVTATPPIVLQPMERAIIRTLSVHPGDVVTKGQILATLDPTFVEADAGSLEKQLRLLRAQVARLEAEAGGLPFAAGPSPSDDDLLQETLYRQRQAEYVTRLRVFDEDIERLRASRRAVDDGRDSLGRELEIARAVEKVRATLLQLQSGSRLSLLEAQAGRMRTERDQQAATDRLPELTHGMEARQGERQAFVDGWRRELLENLVTARNEMARVEAGLAKAERLADLVVVRAPADGVVLDVAPRTEGSVVREAEPLVTIIPSGARMIAEVMIPSGEVGEVMPGADVQLKIDAFPYQRHGLVAARLLSVSEESFSGAAVPEAPSGGRSGATHRARVELLGTKLDHTSEGAHLFPGMTLTAEINAGSRSVLSYFLNPLTRNLGESIREP